MKRALGFMNKALPITYNTYIGNVSSFFTSSSVLASSLGISPANILNFTIDGSDIKCYINTNYTVITQAFDVLITSASLTYYLDLDNKMVGLGINAFLNNNLLYKIQLNGLQSILNGCFSGCTKLKTIYLPALTSSDNSWFSNDYVKRTIYVPNLLVFGTSVGSNGIFTNLRKDSVIYANTYCQTSNSGSPDGDLSNFTSIGGVVKYISNTTAPSSISNLASTTIYDTAIKLTLTPPSSTNAIDYYEVYINDNLHQKIYASGCYVLNLQSSTNYNIYVKTVDIYFNKSTSNTINVSTNTTVKDYSGIFIANSLITDSTIISAIQTLTTSLVSGGIMAKKKAIYPVVGGTEFCHKLNLKNPNYEDDGNTLLFFGTWTHSANGMTPSSAYANTFFNFLTENSQNNLSLGYYSRTNVSGNQVEIGLNNQAYLLYSFSGSAYKAFNSAEGIRGSLFSPTTGFLQGNRTSSTVERYHHNNVLKDTLTINSKAVFGNALLGYYGSGGFYSTKQCAFASLGQGLTDAEALNYNAYVDTFQTALGR